MRERTLGIGFIGAGFIAQVAHLPAFLRHPRVRGKAMADARPGLRAAVARAHGLADAATPRAVLDDPAIQAVVICVHRSCQAPLATAALAAGKAVFSEKPMAYSLAEARAALAVAGSRPYALGYMKRHDPGVKAFRAALHEAMGDGSLGEVVQVLLRDFCPTYGAPPPPHVRTDDAPAFRYPASPRGPDWLPDEFLAEFDYGLNVLSHDLNLLRFLFGDVFSADRLVVRPGRGQAVALAAPGFDAQLTLGRSESGRWDQSVEVLFRRGRLVLHLPSPLDPAGVARWERHYPGGTVTPALSAGPAAFHAQAANFVAACLDETPLAASAEDGLNDLALIESLWREVVWRP